MNAAASWISAVLVILDTGADGATPSKNMGTLWKASLPYFFLWTFAATLRRSAFSRMKPVASSWL